MCKTPKYNLVNVIFGGCLIYTFSYSVFSKIIYGNLPSDFDAHINFARQLIDEGLLDTFVMDAYPLWQILTALSTVILKMPIAASAVFVCAMLNLSVYVIVYCFFKYYKLENGRLGQLTCALMVMGPMYIIWDNPNIYLGQGTPNIWHNPTTICVRPLALGAFILITRILQKYDELQEYTVKELVVLAVLLIFCNLAKPSFEQAVIPGLGLYFIIRLIRNRGRHFAFYFKIAIAFVPSVVLLAAQWFISFYGTPAAGEDNHIAVSLFEVMKLYTPNILISFLLGMAFPLYVIICNWKEIRKKTDLQILGCTLMAAYLQQALLMETGYRKAHGNFCWAWNLCMFLAYVFSMREFLIWNEKYDYEKKGARVMVSVGWGLFFLQTAIGVYYAFYMDGLWMH